MADNIRVLDCRVDELAANLNSVAGEWSGQVWNFYDRTVVQPCPICARAEPHLQPGPVAEIERRVTVVMGRFIPPPVQLPPGFDPRGNRRN